TTLVGGCSPDRQDRESFGQKYDTNVFENIDELLSETEPDIVSICSPSSLHYEHVCKCLEAETPMIWLEKPPAVNLEDTNQLIEKEKSSKSTIAVGFQRRYSSCYSELRDLYAGKLLGETKSVHLTYSRGLLLNGSHIIDTLFFVLGDDAQLSLEYVLSGDKNNPSFCFKSSSGLLVHVEGASLPYHCIDITLTCKKGRASVLYGGIKTREELVVEHEYFPGFYRLSEQKDSKVISSGGGIDNVLASILEDLIESHQKGIKPQSNLRSARNTMAIIDNINNFAAGAH
ncbi:Gfo/Idh/MocA family oxidoreductase, partial [Candidatus Pacearchaeota archaeon]|nr:Gfo/Idh/MocA family oxidoreductase [Candidatus Pacearchaeota archaeon]